MTPVDPSQKGRTDRVSHQALETRWELRDIARIRGKKLVIVGL
jgi:hypothetical protein